VLLIDFVEVDLEVNLSSDIVVLSVTGLQGEPAIIRLFVLDKIRAETDMAKEGLAVRSIIYGDVYFGVVTNDVTGGRLVDVKMAEGFLDVQDCIMFPLGVCHFFEGAVLSGV
jgi:hypothetical protein